MARLSSQAQALLRLEKISKSRSGGVQRDLRTVHADGKILEKTYIDGHDYGWKVRGKTKAGLTPQGIRDSYIKAGFTVLSFNAHYGTGEALRTEEEVAKAVAAKAKRAAKAKSPSPSRHSSFKMPTHVHRHIAECLDKGGRVACGIQAGLDGIDAKHIPRGGCKVRNRLLSAVLLVNKGQKSLFSGGAATSPELREQLEDHARGCEICKALQRSPDGQDARDSAKYLAPSGVKPKAPRAPRKVKVPEHVQRAETNSERIGVGQGLMPGTQVLVNGRDVALVAQAFPTGSHLQTSPHYSVNFIDGDRNVRVPWASVTEQRTSAPFTPTPPAPFGPVKFYEALPTAKREALFKYMRKLDEDMLRNEEQARRLAPAYGEVGAGAADFDEFVKAEAIGSFLSALRNGATPDVAREKAREAVREATTIHNRKRQDSTWRRASMTCDNQIDAMWRETCRVSGL